MLKFVPAAILAGLAILASASDALAGQITAATGGAVKVNGKAVTLPCTIQKGDTINTGGATATFVSDAGDKVTLDPETTARSEGTDGGIEYLFLVSGTGTGDLSEKTSVGVAVAWASAPKGRRTNIRVEAPAERPGIEGRFRTGSGGTWLRNAGHTVWLPELQAVTLWTDRKKPGSMCYRTSQQNTTRIEISRFVPTGTIKVRVPKAASGCIENYQTSKTRISNDITSNKQEKVEIQCDFGAASSAQIGPGTYAIIDNTTGGIETYDETADDSQTGDALDYDAADSSGGASATKPKKP